MAAIWMWRGISQEVWTTTLYPIDTLESLSVSVSPFGGKLEPIAYEAISASSDLISGSYTQKRWFYSDGPYLEYLKAAPSVISGSYVQKRWFYSDFYEESIEHTMEVISGTYVRLKIIATSPDEKLQMNVVLGNDCTMDAI